MTLVVPFVLGALPAQGPDATTILRGRVSDVLGEPVPAAQIVAVVGGRVVARTASDGAGVYHLPRVPAALVELRVSAPGKATRHQGCQGLEKLRLCNLILEDGCRLHGRVLDAAGAAVAGASVFVVAGGQSREASAGADGTFEFASLPMQQAVVRAVARGGCAQRELRLVADGDCELTLPAAEPGSRVARVRGLPADAIPRTRIEVTSPDLALLPGRGSLPLRADCSAEFVVRESCLLRVVAPGFAASPEGVLIDRGGRQPLEFFVAPAPSGPPTTTVVHGRVLDDRSRSPAGLRLVGLDRAEREVGRTRVAADGSFLLPVALLPGELCRVGLELGDFQIAGDEVRVRHGCSWLDVHVDSAAALDLGVEPPTGIRGELRTASGDRGAFAEVVVAAAEGARETFSTAIADHDGAFELRGLPAATWQVTCIAGNEVVTAEVEVVRCKMAKVVEWTPVPSGTIEGEVTDGRQRAAAGVTIQLWSPDLDPSLAVRHVVTDRHGRFRLRGAAAGEWRAAVADAEPMDPVSVDLAAGATRTVSLQTSR